MKPKIYLKIILPKVAFNLICLALLSCFLYIVNLPSVYIFTIILAWTIISVSYYIVTMFKRISFYNKLNNLTTHISNLENLYGNLPFPKTEEQKIILSVVQKYIEFYNSNIFKNDNDKTAYKDFITKWIHEIKTPISVLYLMIENNDILENKKVEQELAIINNLVEKVLFLSKSDVVEKDYCVKSLRLDLTAKKVITKYKSYFIERNIEPEILLSETYVYSDEKWLEFIISQLIENALKYSDSKLPFIRIEIKTQGTESTILVTNNGATIPKTEIVHIFEKGFVGSVGRTNNHSTGMGLYIAKTLCEKLNHEIDASSDDNITCFSIKFNHFDAFN